MKTQAQKERAKVKARELYQARIVAGICPKCSKPRDGEETCCEKCRMKAKYRVPDHCPPERLKSKADWQKALRDKRKSEGLCIKCGKSSDGYSSCSSCRDTYKQQRIRREAA